MEKIKCNFVLPVVSIVVKNHTRYVRISPILKYELFLKNVLFLYVFGEFWRNTCTSRRTIDFLKINNLF